MTDIKLSTRFLGDAIERQTETLQKTAREHLGRLQAKSCVGSEWVGWYNYPQTAGFEQEENIRAYVQSLPVTYDLVLVIGIGGSYLGTRAVTEALLHTYQGTLRDNRPMIAYAGHHVSETQL